MSTSTQHIQSALTGLKRLEQLLPDINTLPAPIAEDTYARYTAAGQILHNADIAIWDLIGTLED